MLPPILLTQAGFYAMAFALLAMRIGIAGRI
jgi:hypothetical protein